MQMREGMQTLDDFLFWQSDVDNYIDNHKHIWNILGDNFLKSVYTKINAGNTSARRVANAGHQTARCVDNVGQECTRHVETLCNFAVKKSSKQT